MTPAENGIFVVTAGHSTPIPLHIQWYFTGIKFSVRHGKNLRRSSMLSYAEPFLLVEILRKSSSNPAQIPSDPDYLEWIRTVDVHVRFEATLQATIRTPISSCFVDDTVAFARCEKQIKRQRNIIIKIYNQTHTKTSSPMHVKIDPLRMLRLKKHEHPSQQMTP